MNHAAATTIEMASGSHARFTPRERRLTITAVMIVFFLSGLDQTVVATAMPRIISELHGIALYSWVTTAYLLTSTVMVAIWGKLSDQLGRKPVLTASILFFLAGSCLSGLAGEFGSLPVLGGGMVQLVIFRALQGIGGGGLFTTGFTIMADLYPPEERAKLGGLFGAVFALSSILGPLIGGFFTDHGTVHWFGHTIAGWRFVFYVNLPLCLVALLMILLRMPATSHSAKGKIDVLGAALITAAVVPLLLALTWGGARLPWTSPQILLLFAGSAAALAAYVAAERFAPDPILPVALFRNRVFASANLGGFLVSMSFMSTVAFLPLFIQLAQGAAATTSGLAMLPLLLGVMSSAMLTGRLAARTGRSRSILLAGLLLTGLAIWLLTRLTPDSSVADVAWRVLLLGVGLGPTQSLLTIAVQNAATPSQMGVVTSSSQFFRQIGSTMGVALFGTVLTGYLRAALGARMPGADLDALREMAAVAHAARLPPEVRGAVASAITQTFSLGLIVLAGAVLAIMFMPPITLRSRPAPGPAEASKRGRGAGGA